MIEIAAVIALALMATPASMGANRKRLREYRNSDKRYQYEHTTRAEMSDVRHADHPLINHKRLAAEDISLRNDHTPHVRAPYFKVHGAEILREGHGEVPSA